MPSLRLLVTAGPTREALDPVRFLSNRSSGKMGYAIAAAGTSLGAEVILISGPVCLAVPPGVLHVPVTSAQEMFEAVRESLPSMQAAIFAAAVADYRPALVSPEKIKKSSGGMTLELERTPDILGSVRSLWQWPGFLAGFAAETQDVIKHARSKLERKGCDLLVANDVSRTDSGFDSEDNAVTLLFRGGTAQELPLLPKLEAARIIVEHCLAGASSILRGGGGVSGQES